MYPNIAIACPNCNLSLKRVGEQERLEKLGRGQKKNLILEVQCDGKECKVECESYKS